MKLEKMQPGPVRYRATLFGAGLQLGIETYQPTMQRTRSAAIKEAVDHLLAQGSIVVDEVPVRRVTKVEYVEEES